VSGWKKWSPLIDEGTGPVSVRLVELARIEPGHRVLDVATPPQVATRELLPHLPNGDQVVLDGFGHSLDFWTYQPEASSRLINTFFDSGRVDDSLYEPQRVDFRPEVTQTALAKGIAGSMVSLPLLTVASLAWMARGCTSEDASDARPVRHYGRSTRSSLAWADGSWESWSPSH
jgi:hypothetical protein